MIEVYTDGATNEGYQTSGIGISMKVDGKQKTYAIPYPFAPNHEVEFAAVVKALEICQRDYPDSIISLRSDSKTVVDIVEKGYTKNPNFQPFLEKINQSITSFPLFFIKWIPSAQNKYADSLAKQATRLKI